MHARTMMMAVASMLAILALASPALGQTAAPAAELKLFAVEIRTGPKWDPSKPPQDQGYFREHSANLKRLRDAGSLVMGARYSDKGLLVLAAPSIADARLMMEGDPSIGAGTFVFDVHDFNVFYPGTVQAAPRRPSP